MSIGYVNLSDSTAFGIRQQWAGLRWKHFSPGLPGDQRGHASTPVAPLVLSAPHIQRRTLFV